jgi:hypothetical protein
MADTTITVNANVNGITEFSIPVDNRVKRGSSLVVADTGGLCTFTPVTHRMQLQPGGRKALIRMKTATTNGADRVGQITVTVGADNVATLDTHFRTAQGGVAGSPVGKQTLKKKLFLPQEVTLPVTGFWKVTGTRVKSSRCRWAVLDTTQVPGGLRLVLACRDYRVNTVNSTEVAAPPDAVTSDGSPVVPTKEDVFELIVTMTPDGEMEQDSDPVPINYEEPTDEDGP